MYTLPRPPSSGVVLLVSCSKKPLVEPPKQDPKWVVLVYTQQDPASAHLSKKKPPGGLSSTWWKILNKTPSQKGRLKSEVAPKTSKNVFFFCFLLFNYFVTHIYIYIYIRTRNSKHGFNIAYLKRLPPAGTS